MFRSLFRRVDASSLAFLRIAFGLVMAWEVVRYWSNGWIRAHYAAPSFHFTYYFFQWVRPLPGNALYAFFATMFVLALCIAAGFCYRVATALFACGFLYWFMLDQTQYLNHFYLITLVSFLLIFTPTHRAFSVDAHLRPTDGTAPAWALWLMRFQIAVPYFFGGVAKLNADWMRCEPMRLWLQDARSFPVVGPLLASEPSAIFFAWGGLLFDLFIVPLLLWKRTRPFAFAGCVFFHVSNALLFHIGIFPWLMIAATTIYFEPDWPKRLGLVRRGAPVPPDESIPELTPRRKIALGALGAWVLVQVLVPFRHVLYPGPVSWTEEGHRFSWHMKLRDKQGRAEFRVRLPEKGREFRIEPRDFLTARQLDQMVDHPDMILQFAHHVAAHYRAKGHSKVEVRAKVYLALNGRREQLLIDPEVDLAAQPRDLGRCSWILPLTEKLP